MNIINTIFDDLYVIDYKIFTDDRGEFVKTIHEETFLEHNLEFKFSESFYSVSKKNVIRGMHFQKPPADHAKLVYVVTGSIIDVVLDLRTSSKNFGKYFVVELSAENRKGIYIGKGFAHGFLALEDNTTVEYHTTTVQDRNCEDGIRFDSFGYIWPTNAPIVSVRDSSFNSLENFKSPF